MGYSIRIKWQLNNNNSKFERILCLSLKCVRKCYIVYNVHQQNDAVGVTWKHILVIKLLKKRAIEVVYDSISGKHFGVQKLKIVFKRSFISYECIGM